MPTLSTLDALDPRIHPYRAPVHIGITSATARSDKVMRKHNALARTLLDRQDDYSASPEIGEYPPITTGERTST